MRLLERPYTLSDNKATGVVDVRDGVAGRVVHVHDLVFFGPSGATLKLYGYDGATTTTYGEIRGADVELKLGDFGSKMGDRWLQLGDDFQIEVTGGHSTSLTVKLSTSYGER